MRRRLTRKAKKEFQSSAAEEGPGFAVVVAAEKKRPDEAMGRESRVVVLVVGVLKRGVEDGRALQSWRVTGDQRRAIVLNGEAMVELMVVCGVW